MLLRNTQLMAKATEVIKKNGKEIKTFFDDQENNIISTEGSKTIIIDIKLVSEKRRRRIGVLTKSTGAFNVVRTREKHLHRISNSYGFNYRILEMANKIKTIVLTDDVSRYKIPKDYVMKNTNFLFFKQQGFELQTFVSLAQLQQFEVGHAF